MDKREYKELIEEDYRVYDEGRGLSKLRLKMQIPGYKITVYNRKCHYYASKSYLKPLAIITRLKYHSMCMKYGVDIPSATKLGKGFHIAHMGGIVINHETVIGDYVSIRTGVCIGAKDGKAPVIGNNVDIGVNATIIGGITIGDGAKIGAGAIVVDDVPAGAVAVSAKARVL